MTHTETITVSPAQKALFTELQQLTISAETLKFLGYVEEMEPGQIARSLTDHLCDLSMRAEDEPGNLYSTKEMVFYLRLQQFLMSWEEDRV